MESERKTLVGIFFYGVVKLYENIFFRMAITLVAIILAYYFWHRYYPNPTAQDYIAFRNLWITCAYAVSTLITGVLFIALFYHKKEEVREIGLLGWLIFIVFLVLTLMQWKYIDSNSTFFSILPIFFPFIVLVYDGILSYIGLEGLQNGKWKDFDLAVLVGVTAVVVLQKTIEGVPDALICGLGGGGTAFQLILANMVFDPNNYYR